MDAFISHSSKNRAVATRLETALEAQGLRVWLDDSEIRLGVLLREELQTSIQRCRMLVLLWSKSASESRWINAEWLMAFHLGKFIVPCVLDDTALPQCLQSSVFLNLTRVGVATVDRLTRAIKDAPAAANPLAPVMRSEEPELKKAINGLVNGQQAMMDRLLKREVDTAAQIQALLDTSMDAAIQLWPLDPVIVNLGGYHLKNAYMLKYWDAIQAGRAPRDELLDQAERRFFEALWIDPTDPSALNGLGSILILERELAAAEFFIRAAIAAAKKQGMASYPAAEHDLGVVLHYKRT